jgi:two-component system nitrate/nitrite response regulator NarL
LSVQLVITQEAKSVSRKRVGLSLKTSLIRAGLEHILLDGGFDVMPAQQDLRAAQPGIVIVEADSPLAKTVAAIDRVKASCPTSSVVVLADTFDLDGLVLLQGAGADGFCLTTMKPEVVVKALEIVMLGEMFIPSELLETVLKGGTSHPVVNSQVQKEPAVIQRAPLGRLSEREVVILRMVMQGDPNKVIAKKLDIAEATVKVHMKAILRKVGAANRTQAAIWASEQFVPGSDFGDVNRR